MKILLSFIAALLTTAKMQKQPKHPSIDEWISRTVASADLAPDVADVPLAPLATQTPLHHLTRGNQFLG